MEGDEQMKDTQYCAKFLSANAFLESEQKNNEGNFKNRQVTKAIELNAKFLIKNINIGLWYY